MARKPPKRQHVDDRPRSGAEPPHKKPKTHSETELEAWSNWIYPPAFWDGLSKLQLTRKAVAEHNRRLRLQQHPSPSLRRCEAHERAEQLAHTLLASGLARFARHGGPNLTDLRGYPHPATNPRPLVAMSAGHSLQSEATKSTDPASTLPTSVTTKTTKTTKTKKSTPYNRDFEVHLTDHGILPVYSSQKPDLTNIQVALAVPRPSLSPSTFSESAFEKFQESNNRAKDEDDVMANVLPTILGTHQPSQASARNTVFRNLAPLTDGTIVPAAPDIYYGAHPEELCRPVREALGSFLIPSTMQEKPLAPNFFVEAKGPEGSAAVATRQARYDGAIGSRAMHILQNHGEEEPKYDNQAYTYSSTYHGGTGTLHLYAHHTTAPTSEGERPKFHMTKIRGFDMTDTRETFVLGATAFRNARDLAKKHRDNFIQAANAPPRTSASRTIETQEGAGCFDWKDSDEELQQSIVTQDEPPSWDDSEEPSQDSVGHRADPSMSFASSCTSIVTGAKRPLQTAVPASPAAGRDRAPKSQKRSRAKRAAGSTTPQTEANESQEDAQ
ncbi:hypothetical protein SEUCBS140593_010516 [Sporothrix eucalyptigena]|uniref:DUF7924 domain-containing protein n=1 Tax=Sporothrix eucalyptigena TaxID=1812306 RepID=A0ABP0D3C0_9PEZI